MKKRETSERGRREESDIKFKSKRVSRRTT